MVQCFKCNKRGNLTQHHIDGNGTHLPLEDQNNDPSNLITLCPSCHDIVEGVCNQCYQRDDCNRTRFMDCWRFEDAIPPLHFKTREEIFMEKYLYEETNLAKCPKCNSASITRISYWKYDGVYKENKNWIAIYECNKCKAQFRRTMTGFLEQMEDNKKIPIKIQEDVYVT